MKQKVYISLPITGHEKTVRARWDAAVNKIRSNKFFGDDVEFYGPNDIDSFDENGKNYTPEDEGKDWAWYMGECIKDLLRCDVIYMTSGYRASAGCRTELAIARERQMTIVIADDADDIIVHPV